MKTYETRTSIQPIGLRDIDDELRRSKTFDVLVVGSTLLITMIGAVLPSMIAMLPIF